MSSDSVHKPYSNRKGLEYGRLSPFGGVMEEEEIVFFAKDFNTAATASNTGGTAAVFTHDTFYISGAADGYASLLIPVPRNYRSDAELEIHSFTQKASATGTAVAWQARVRSVVKGDSDNPTLMLTGQLIEPAIVANINRAQAMNSGTLDLTTTTGSTTIDIQPGDSLLVNVFRNVSLDGNTQQVFVTHAIFKYRAIN